MRRTASRSRTKGRAVEATEPADVDRYLGVVTRELEGLPSLVYT